MERYTVSINKTEVSSYSTNGSAVAGAIFDLYRVTFDDEGNASESIETDTTGDEMKVTTDTSGQAIFSTGVNSYYGFKKDVLYYIVETDAPEGYTPDSTKHYFCFCATEGGCETCQAYAEMVDAEVTIINATYSANYSTTVNVTNTYTAEVTLDLGVSKTYNSWSTMAANESFVFRLGTTSGAPLPDGETLTTTRDDGTEIKYASISISGSDAANTADGNALPATFGTITFTAPDTYTYYLTEIRTDSMPSGVSITGVREYIITVEVTDENHNGELTVQITEITYPISFSRISKALKLVDCARAASISRLKSSRCVRLPCFFSQ